MDAISALGVPETQHWAGEEARSTRHVAMNITLVASGARVLLAGLVLAPFVPRAGRRFVLPLVLAHATGLVIVGFFPSSTGGLRASMHGVGAMLAIVGGTVLLLAIAISLARRHPRLAAFTGVCAAISAVGTGGGASGGAHFGLFERIAVDAVVGWQVVVGALVLLAVRTPSSVGLRQGE